MSYAGGILSIPARATRWREARKHLKWKQREVAEWLRFTRPGTITEYETGAKPIPDRTLRDFAGLFEDSVDVLRWLDLGGERPLLRARSPVGQRSVREPVSGHPYGGGATELAVLQSLAADLMRKAYNAGFRDGQTSPPGGEDDVVAGGQAYPESPRPPARSSGDQSNAGQTGTDASSGETGHRDAK